MTLNLRMSLLCAICILISGLLGSYKSFQVHQDHTIKKDIASSQEISRWVAQSLEQKLIQMEAAVSYLDKSTIETLKRSGARYFAYAYKNKEEWSLKWKVLGDAGKEQILSEVNQLPFDKLSVNQRSWAQNKSGQIIYISPLELAESHQLKSGFLIFGMGDEFFGFLSSADEKVSLVSLSSVVIHNELPVKVIDSEKLFANSESVSGSLTTEQNGEAVAFTSFFSPLAQLWIVRQQTLPTMTFLRSSFFTYFLLASVLSILFFLVIMSRYARPSIQKGSIGEAARQGFSVPKIKIPNLSRLFFKPKRNSVANSRRLNHTEVEAIEDFAELLDEILQDDLERLSKVGVSIKTQVEEGAKVMCSPQHISDFIKRLVGNSVLALEGSEEKEIQIQLVQQQDSYQLIYVDTRSQDFPTGHEPSLLLQTEGSMEGIDGIIAYASWLFGEALTVAKKGFCLSVDLSKEERAAIVLEPEVIPLVETVERIELDEHDTDLDAIANFVPLNTLADRESTDDESSASFDKVIEQFQMKEFTFKEEQETLLAAEAESRQEETVVTDDRGLFEFNSGQFKIKIRSPKKRDADVNC